MHGKQRIRISVAQDAREPFSLPHTATQIIEENWIKLTERRPALFNSKLLRIIAIEDSVDEGGGIVVTVSPDVTYKDVVGLRYSEGCVPKFVEAKHRFQTLSCYALVTTSDGHAIMTHRDCGDWSIAVDMPGGFIQAQFNIEDVADFARTRVAEDLCIPESDIVDVTMLGTHDFMEILEFMCVYHVRLALTLEEIQNKSEQEIIALPNGYQVSEHGTFISTRIHFGLIDVARKFLPAVGYPQS